MEFWLPVALGFPLGVIVGRWWATLAVVPFGIWWAAAAEPEFPSWYLGVFVAGVGAIPIVLGVGLRKAASRSR